MPKIIKNGKEYSGVPIEVVTAWAPTADPVQVKEPLMGNTDISSIGDGTVTGAIDNVKSGLTNLLKTVEVSFADTPLPTNALFQVTKTFDPGNGYTPVSIASYNLSRVNGLYITRIQFGATSVTIGGHNASSTSLLHGTVHVLCAKTIVLS